jgi:hypothetical protein
VAQLARDLVDPLGVVSRLPRRRLLVHGAQARHRVLLRNRDGDREEGVSVACIVTFVMEAHRDLQAHFAEVTMVFGDPPAEPARDAGEHRVIHRGAGERLGRVMEGLKGRHCEAHAPQPADPPIERRGPATPGELALEERGEVTAATGVVLQRGAIRGRGRPTAGPGLVLEQELPSEAHARRPVGDRVVDAPHQRRALIERQHVEPPERARAVQVLGEELGNCVAEPAVVEATGELGIHHVLTQVERGILDPRGGASRPAQPAGESGSEADPLSDQLPQGVPSRRPRAEHDDLAGVPGDRVAFELEDRAVLVREWNRLGHAIPLYHPRW